MIDMDRWLAIPYKREGRGPGGCDCWGFVALVFAAERGVDLLGAGPAGFERLAAPEDWSIALERRGAGWHCGIWIGGRILQMTRRGAVWARPGRRPEAGGSYYRCRL